MDIFGIALLDYQKGIGDQAYRIHRDDGWWAEDHAERYFQLDSWPHEILALSNVSDHTLDIGCGAGRRLLWFKRHGINAVGNDASKEAVEVCRLRNCNAALEFDVMSDTCDGKLSKADTITLLGNNIGIDGSFAGACTLFERLKDLSKPDGKMILTGIDVTATENPTHLAYHEKNRAAGRRRSEIKMRFEYNDQMRPWISWYILKHQRLMRSQRSPDGTSTSWKP
jgi:SAM-dependent methyltransferase